MSATSPEPPKVERLVSPDGQHRGLAGWLAWEAWARSNLQLFNVADTIARRDGYPEVDRLRLLLHAHVLRNVELEAEAAYRAR